MSPDPFGALTVERLDTSNYLIWAPRMEYFLTTKGLWEAVTTDDAPVADCRKARAIIGLCVTSQHLATIQRSKTAKEAWDSLAAIFKTKGTALKLRLRRDLSSFKMAAGEPLTKYFARAKALQDKLLESFPDFKEEDIFWPTVQGLPSTYDTILTIIENTADAELTLDSVLPKLMQVEQRQRGPDRPDRSNETALLAKPSFTFRRGPNPTSGSRGPPPRRDERSGRRPDDRRSDDRRPSFPPPHDRRSSYPRSNERQYRPRNPHEERDFGDGTCLYCHKPGHWAGDADGRTIYVSTEPPPSEFVTPFAAAIPFSCAAPPEPAAFSAQAPPTPGDTCRFVLDTGASRHMTPLKSALTNLRPPPDNLTVTFGNGAQAEPTAVGDIHLELAPGRIATITDVLYLPTAAESLFSISYAAQKGYTFSFGADGCTIYRHSTTVATAPATANNIYYLEGRLAPTSGAPTTAYAARTVETPHLWHRSLGHLGFDNLAKMPDMVTGIRVTAAEFKTAGANALCEPCTLGKQHRLPFNTSTSATKAPLELLHTDLCGPLPVASAGGSLYFNTILDDFTGMSFVIPLRHKSDAADSIIHTVTMLQRQAGLPVKRAERLNRTLWEKARPMLSDAGLPKHLWADAIVTANYLRNRSPLSGRDKTPFELFYGTKPDVSHLRIFGATVFAHTPSALRTKLDPVSQPGRLIGYAANRKGYKILLNSGAIITSRDVTFDESKPPKPTSPTSHKPPSQPETSQPEPVPFAFDSDTEDVGGPVWRCCGVGIEVDAELTLDSVLPKLMQVEQRQRGPDRPDRSNETALLAKPSFTFRRGPNPTSGSRGPPPRRDERSGRRPDDRRSDDRRPSFPPPHDRRSSYPRFNERQYRPRNPHEERDFGDGTCLYCHKPGHWAGECGKKKADMEAAAARRRPGGTPPTPRHQQYSAIAFTAMAQPSTEPKLSFSADGRTIYVSTEPPPPEFLTPFAAAIPFSCAAPPEPAAFSAQAPPTPGDTCRFVLDTGAPHLRRPLRHRPTMSPDPFGALTVERLDTSNYLIWAPRMEYFLTTKGLWEAVTTDDAPVADCRKARAIIGLCVTSQHLATIQRSKTAKEAWDSLAAIFKTKGTALKLRLRRDLSSFKMAAGEPLTKYFARAKALQDKLLESFPDFKEEDIFWPTVQGLPSTYDTILTIIENTADAELTLDSVLPKLMQVEQRQRGPDRPDRSNETALLAKPSFTFRRGPNPTSGSRGPPPRRDERSGRRPDDRRSDDRRPSFPPPHDRRSSYPRSNERQYRPRNPHEERDFGDGTCLYCHKPGHWAGECGKKKADMEAAAARRRPGGTPPTPRHQQYSAIAFTAMAQPSTELKLSFSADGRTIYVSTEPPPSEFVTPFAAAIPFSCAAPPEPAAFSAQAPPTPGDTCRFVLDTGASRHMTPLKSALTNLRPPPDNLTVTFGNGAQAEPTAVGDIHLELAPGRIATITDVLYLPTAAESLFSVSYAAQKGYTFSFGADGCTIYRHSTTVATAPATANNIYYLEGRLAPTSGAPTTAYAARTVETPHLWHRSLGHLGFDNLAKMPDMVTGIRVTAAEFKTAGANALCEPCTLGKQHRLPFNTSTSATKAPLELLHTDLCGPLPVASAGGSLYFNTILDDFTGMSFVIPLRHKSDAADSIIHTVTMLQRQAGLPVKRAERLNRTLWEKARPMLSDAGLPKHLWADAIVTANYLRNRSPLSGRDKTPFELFYGTKPDVSHLRIFGATVFAHTPSALRTKLDPVSQPGRLIGYAANRKGYKILLNSGAIITSRDVTFDESKPPKPTSPTSHKPPSQPETSQPEPVPFAFDSDTEDVGAAADAQPPPEDAPPPSPPLAQRRQVMGPIHADKRDSGHVGPWFDSWPGESIIPPRE
ncbi:Retrovirus-related Pol poly from transposon TNT 1-94 [Micractinium conductrix]|uniref:Retrovirus-related Pol poly from transposon TNT 1-94 n=1 Tax=Micractinium conductrix TaxID=554055 RepID=A0A2P6V0Z3_9CHLO|nr:Retrovirus-related Pol poly from transposon TNT 1-94 [Micractinium conductrix]|eukprot:PSC67759.1 Retrovirus-related Pol poly from transposon TNT 1-94 [Micractinium conductrix]